MKISELRTLPEDALLEQLSVTREQLMQFRFKNRMRQLDHTAQIPQLKHRIAQIQTVLAEHRRQARPVEDATNA